MEIDDLREQIRKKDLEMISLIAERIGYAERIAEIKVKDGLPIRDPDVERKVIGRYVSEGKAKGISEDVMTAVAEALIEGSVEAENRIAEKIIK